MFRSLVAVTGVTTLGILLAACTSATQEDVTVSGSAWETCSLRTGCEKTTTTCTKDAAVAGKCCTPEFEKAGYCKTTTTCDPAKEKCEAPPPADGQKPGKTTCGQTDLKDPKFYDFKDPVTGKPFSFIGHHRIGRFYPDKSNPRVGLVDCVHVDTFDPARVTPPAGTVYGGTQCKFVLDDNNTTPYVSNPWSQIMPAGRSGAYIRSGTDIWVPIGQRVEKPNGDSGGWYVTGTRPDAITGETPCLPATGNDSAAAVAGSDLSATCMIEVGGGSTNASGMPLQNVATRDVCTYSNPHPDFTPIYRGVGAAAGTHCWTELGAAVNDNNGQRDGAGVYYGADWSCHLVVSGGVEVPAGKRPSTRSYPKPGVVNTQSWLSWQVVNSYVAIAN